jgi:hypothetical protein
MNTRKFSTLDILVCLWCALSSGFAVACGVGILASSVAIQHGKADSQAAGLMVLILAGSAWFCASVGVYRLVRRVLA